MIIGCPLTPLNSLKDDAGIRRRDDNSRKKVQDVRGDSSENHQHDLVYEICKTSIPGSNPGGASNHKSLMLRDL